MRKEQWTIKTLVEEAVNSDSPEATKERYPTAHWYHRSGLQI